MDLLAVECLQCGTTRMARRDQFKHHFECPECPECGYLGWMPVLQQAKPERTKRRRPQRAARRLHVVA
jgi:ssDNA-binding Zn-finger/Zn-ribbon topoisomerase 1